jgi:hypothetical protein
MVSLETNVGWVHIVEPDFGKFFLTDNKVTSCL